MLSDAMVSRAALWGPERLRRWAARRAADRGLHWIALRAARADPYVLSALGLFPQARSHAAQDARGAWGRAIADAALDGALPSDAALRSADERVRRRLAGALAPSAPGKAAEILPRSAVDARAACLLADGATEQAAGLLGEPDSRERWLLAAHLALSLGDNRGGRKAWNKAFTYDGLNPPFEECARPLTADALRSAAVDHLDGPRISVVVPFRDAEATLGHTLDSLTAQSWSDIEILAIDDGSADGGTAVARQRSQADPRITLLENDGTPGVYGARNRAIERASGRYVTFLDADDWSPPERLARQLAALRRGAAVSVSNHVRIDAQGRPVAPRVFPLARPVPITMMIGRDALLAAGPFEEVETGADSEMLGRLQMRFGRKAIARDPALLLVARWREGSLSEAREGGLFGEQRLAYRAEWMFRHAGLAPPLARPSRAGLDNRDAGRPTD